MAKPDAPWIQMGAGSGNGSRTAGTLLLYCLGEIPGSNRIRLTNISKQTSRVGLAVQLFVSRKFTRKDTACAERQSDVGRSGEGAGRCDSMLVRRRPRGALTPKRRTGGRL